MFVVSFSRKNFIKFFVPLMLLFVFFIAVFVYNFCTAKLNEDASVQSVGYSVNNSAQIIEFINSFGWEVSDEADEIREIIIPPEFNDVFLNYNALQSEQGYDLSEYKGDRVKRWTYTVLNYPGYEGKEFIKINVLVHNGVVIGGDVCSVELNGFMHGFEKGD